MASNIKAKVDVKEFTKRLKNLKRGTKKAQDGLMRKTIIWFSESAIKETGPGTSSYKGLPKKFKERKVMSSRPDKKFWVVKTDENNESFLTDKMHRSWKNDKWIKVKKCLQFWNREANAWDWIPATEENVRKWTKIKFAGAAKGAWTQLLRQLGKGSEAGLKGASKIEKRDRADGMEYTLHNMIKYCSKIFDVGSALGKTIRRLEGEKKNTVKAIVNAYR